MRILLGSLAGGAVLTAWIIFSWGVLPFRHDMAHLEPTDDAEVFRVLSENLERPGVYMSLYDEPEDPELRTAFLNGPSFVIQYPGGGHDAGLMGTIVIIMVVLLAPLVPAGMLYFASPAVQSSYLKRVAFIAAFGLFLGLFAEPFQVAYGGQPVSYAAFLAVHDILGWILVGAVVAAIVRPAAAPSPASVDS